MTFDATPEVQGKVNFAADGITIKLTETFYDRLVSDISGV